MILIIPYDKINIHNINFGFKIKNTNYKNQYYYNLIYSNTYYNISNLYISFQLQTYHIHYNSVKFNPTKYNHLIKTLKTIEHDILEKIKIPKKPKYNLYKQLMKGEFIFQILDTIKPISDILIKISGIWENDEGYGLVYKFYISSDCE